MAGVKTESLKDNITSTKPTVNTRTEKMTVEKQVGQSPLLKNKSTPKESSSDSTSATQTQQQTAPGNAPPSPKKSDSKSSPPLRSSSGNQPPKTPVQQQPQHQQQQGKVKVNPWHKNSPAAPTSGGISKKGSSSVTSDGSTVGTTKSGSTSPKEDPSQSIQIPRDGVCCMV